MYISRLGFLPVLVWPSVLANDPSALVTGGADMVCSSDFASVCGEEADWTFDFTKAACFERAVSPARQYCHAPARPDLPRP